MAALKGKALIAYLIVCVFWGSTYLAIRVGVGELPPFLFAGLRFFIAGAILFVAALALGDKAPSRAVDWRTLTIVGLFLLAGGNAVVVWAEQYTPSGVGLRGCGDALRRACGTVVGTYAYVNPGIAVLPGWVLLKEPVTARTFAAMAMILGAVLWIQLSHRLSRTVGQPDGRTVRRLQS